ncbi:hypothetical protein FOQG_14615 [Fusarium oxysporum f. sp. raphani 54005]|uniref:Uncharacterized protein n=1 Tax=Fusarium oxysporum f. sp. raphani 54005 TaxID=1089458 RepID=X0CE63_FUSOX|nr:hypothetical protein FOQG_14615 [Fusarium oxysporum f. sp. raphani 54005]
MSIEAEKAPLLAWLAKASVKGSLGRKSEEKEAIYSRYQEISGGHRLGVGGGTGCRGHFDWLPTLVVTRW